MNNELPMFSFPPNDKYPFNFDEDRETLLNQDSSFDKFDAEVTKSKFTDAEASNDSVEDTASLKTCSKTQPASEKAEKVIMHLTAWGFYSLKYGLPFVLLTLNHWRFTKR